MCVCLQEFMSAAKFLVFAIGTENAPCDLKQPIVYMFCKKVSRSRRKLKYTRFKSFWTLQITRARKFVSNFASEVVTNYALNRYATERRILHSYILYNQIYYGTVIIRIQGLYRLYRKLEKLFWIRVDASGRGRVPFVTSRHTLLQLHIPFGTSPFPPLFRFHDVIYYQRKWENCWDKAALFEQHKSDTCLAFEFKLMPRARRSYGNFKMVPPAPS